MSTDNIDYKAKYEALLGKHEVLIDQIEGLLNKRWDAIHEINALRKELLKQGKPKGFFGGDSSTLERGENWDDF